MNVATSFNFEIHLWERQILKRKKRTKGMHVIDGMVGKRQKWIFNVERKKREKCGRAAFYRSRYPSIFDEIFIAWKTEMRSLTIQKMNETKNVANSFGFTVTTNEPKKPLFCWDFQINSHSSKIERKVNTTAKIRQSSHFRTNHDADWTPNLIRIEE